MPTERFSCKTVDSIEGNVQKNDDKNRQASEQVQFFNRINFQQHVLYVCKFKYLRTEFHLSGVYRSVNYIGPRAK